MVNVMSEDARKRTSLMLGVETANAELVKMLLDFGPQQITPTIDSSNSPRPRPLACSFHHNINGRKRPLPPPPPLPHACSFSRNIALEALTGKATCDKMGARLLLKGPGRSTPWSIVAALLSMAAALVSRDICALLPDSGADASTKDTGSELWIC